MSKLQYEEYPAVNVFEYYKKVFDENKQMGEDWKVLKRLIMTKLDRWLVSSKFRYYDVTLWFLQESPNDIYILVSFEGTLESDSLTYFMVELGITRYSIETVDGKLQLKWRICECGDFSSDHDDIAESPVDDVPPEESPSLIPGMEILQKYLEKYDIVHEKGDAIWLPTEVAKRLQLAKINMKHNISKRSLAAAIIMTFLEEHGDRLEELMKE